MNRTPTHTACAHAHSVSAHHTAQSGHFSSREHACLKIKDLCAQNSLSCTRNVSFLAAPDTDQQHKFSLTYLSSLAVILYTPKPVVSRFHKYIATIHGGVAVPRISNLPHGTTTTALDEDIKTAALEALVPSELGQHLAMNRSRLITYGQVRSEIQA